MKCRLQNRKYIRETDGSIAAFICNTPLVQLRQIYSDSPVQILAKLEGNNPGGSIKDRTAYAMIEKAEQAGDLVPGKTIIEPTSGNTGIAIAMIGAVKGYQVKLFMPECVSVERRLILEAYGAEAVLTPAAEGVDGAIRRAHEALEAEPERYYMPNQFDNPANTLAHYETTGPEIYRQADGHIDVFIAGMGTTGTLIGTGRYLKEKIPGLRVIGVEPTVGHAIQGLKNLTESRVPGIYDPTGFDEKITVEDNDAFDMSRCLAMREGIFTGMSSGAAVAGALKIAQTMKSGTIVTILPDRGDRYLSTTLFRSICGRCPP